MQIKTVKVYGDLGAKFGREFRLAVNSPAEAIAALAAQLPGFEAELYGAKDRGVGYAVFTNKKNLAEDELVLPSGHADIRIAPIIMGSKRAGTMQIILGGALLAVAAIATGGAALGWGAAAFGSGGLWGTVATFGLSMAIGGVVQLLSPQVKGLSARDNPGDEGSAYFNGPVNTQAQGNPVPYLYGELIVGSAVISAGITTEDGQIDTTGPGGIGGGGGGGTNGGYWWTVINTIFDDVNPD